MFRMHQSRPDPVEDFKVINTELESFGDGTLAEKPLIVVASKIDVADIPIELEEDSTTHVKRRKLEFHAISAVTGQGIDELKWAIAKRLRVES